MAVFRVARINDYTVMSNFHLRDKRLSLKAKGLLSQMLSLPENWDYTLTGLCYINKESKDAIRTAIHELEQAGYIGGVRRPTAAGNFPATSIRSTSSHRRKLCRRWPSRHRKRRQRQCRRRKSQRK